LAVFKFHVEKCVPEDIVKEEPEKTNRLTELVDIFDRFSKSLKRAGGTCNRPPP
jgi:hypothetical protein